jgi:hypothetical protein
VGDKWLISDVSVGVPADERASEVTKAERKDGELFVTVTVFTRRGEIARRDQIRLSDSGEFLIDDRDGHYDPPIRRLPMPLKVGDSWEWEKPGLQKWKFRAVTEEDVEVPAGTFKALRIEGEGTLHEPKIGDRPAKWTEWISPGYPTVKSVIRVGDGSAICDGERTEVLKSFTPAKK